MLRRLKTVLQLVYCDSQQTAAAPFCIGICKTVPCRIPDCGHKERTERFRFGGRDRMPEMHQCIVKALLRILAGPENVVCDGHTKGFVLLFCLLHRFFIALLIQ